MRKTMAFSLYKTNKERKKSRFYVVENPLMMKRIRAMEHNGKKLFKYWPWGDSASAHVVNKKVRQWINLSEVQDKFHGKDQPCPEKIQKKIKSLEDWLHGSGYMCMQDLEPEFAKIVDEHFWELV